MVKKCSICGKSAIFGTIFRCNNCQRDICHRHEKEQFINYYVPGIPEGGNSFYCYNYPDGEPVNNSNFKCYGCRTGNIPKDMGNSKIYIEECMVIFTLASIIISAIMAFLSAFGNLFGLSPETCDNLETACIYFVAAVIAVFIIVSIIMMASYRLKQNKHK